LVFQSLPNPKLVNPFPGVSEAGLRLSTGLLNVKAGLDLNAGYHFGSVTMKGGLGGSATLTPTGGINLKANLAKPEINFVLPHAFVNLNAVGQLKVQTTATAYVNSFSGNPSEVFALPPVSLEKTLELVNLSTRGFSSESNTTSSFSKSFSLGNLFSTSINLPNFNHSAFLPKQVSAEDFRRNTKWSSAVGQEYVYGYEGRSSFLDFETSLGAMAPLLGIPPLSGSRSLDLKLASVKLDYTLADAKIGAKTNFTYSAKVGLRPNLTIQPEGGKSRSLDLANMSSGFTLNKSDYRDVNGDRMIDLTVRADPIIGVKVGAALTGKITAQADVLKGTLSGSALGITKSVEVGPLLTTGQINSPSVNLFKVDQMNVFKASELFPSFAANLSQTFKVPISSV
jgi:hypothetical protein